MATALDLDFQVIGGEQLITKFKRVEGIEYLRPPMQRGLYRLLRRVASYPPARPKSKYVRTGTYGRKWTTEITIRAQSMRGKVGIRLKYGPWVGSYQFQTDVHKETGWVTDRRAVELERDAILSDFNGTIAQKIRSG